VEAHTTFQLKTLKTVVAADVTTVCAPEVAKEIVANSGAMEVEPSQMFLV
jgi:hypothetical protein